MSDHHGKHEQCHLTFLGTLDGDAIAWCLDHVESLGSADAWVETLQSKLEARTEERDQLVQLGRKLLLGMSQACGNGPYGPICVRLTGQRCAECEFKEALAALLEVEEEA